MHQSLSSHLASSPVFATLEPALLARLEPELELVRLAAGEALVRQGEVGHAMYVLVSGELEVRVADADGAEVTVERLAPGASVGEMALVAGDRRSATVLASRPVELVELSRQGFERLAQAAPELHGTVLRQMEPRLQRVQLSGVLETWFDAFGPAELHALQQAVAWRNLPAGTTLYAEGDRADGMYLLVSGRLRLSRRGADDDLETTSEIGRGGSVGEYAVLGEAPRSETVVALRDSQLVRLTRELVAAHPQVIVRIARTALERNHRRLPPRDGRGNGVRTFALVPADGGSHARALARRLGTELGRRARARTVDADAVDAAFGRAGAAQTPRGAASEPALTHWLNEREAEHDQLLFVTDASLTEWTRRCLRQADVVLIVAAADADPAPGAVEREAARVIGGRQLVLVHPDDSVRPSGTARWLAARTDLPFHHLRLANDGDVARLARRVTGRAVGMAFSGGGARGYAHIGLIRAVEEVGMPVDMVAGTSMGALVGATYAMNRAYAFCHAAAAAFGDRRRLIDRTLPLVALTESRGVTAMLRQVFGDTRIEDLWIPFSCVSANLSRAEPVVHRSGPLWEAVRASIAIPGVFTPVLHGGDLLVDGGVMNNFPVDLMRESVTTGTVIGSNAYTQGTKDPGYDFGPSLSGWRVLLQRALPRSRRKPFPSMLGTLMRATSLSSKHRSGTLRGLADLIVEYPAHEFGTMDFDRYEELIAIGYGAGKASLQRWLEESLDEDRATAGADGVVRTRHSVHDPVPSA